MDSRPVPAQYMKAGDDYLESLQGLGLNPDFLGWGWEDATEQWVLVLVTSMIDAGGPLALNEQLFQAYNAQITPPDISPFIVRIFSPEIVPQQIYKVGDLNFLGIDLKTGNSYRNWPAHRFPNNGREEWNRFRSAVESLVAPEDNHKAPGFGPA